MTGTAGIAWLAAILLASVAGMTWSVRHIRPDLTGAAAAIFAVVLIVAAMRTNRPLWSGPIDRIGEHAATAAAARNATMIALAYGWGAAAMAAIYTLSGLVWQHGLQYSAGMGVIALLLAAYARNLSRPDSPLRADRAQLAMLRLTCLHAVAAAIGIGLLFVSGKLKSGRGDWAANVVFLIGGLAVLALSVIAAVTQQRLARQR